MRWYHLTLVAALIQLTLTAAAFAADIQLKIDQLNQREKQLIEKLDALQQRERYIQNQLDEVRHRKDFLLNQQAVRKPGKAAEAPTP
jgi:uncharacterized coiled-coil DUF342 family protein